MVLAPNISNDDFFKLLKHRIPTSYSTRYTDVLSEKIIFKESIEALKRINDFAQEVSDDIWDAEVFISKFKYKKDHQQLAEFCQVFDAIRLQKDLFPHPEIFNHLFFKSVYEAYRYSDQDLNFNLSVKFTIAMDQSLQKDVQFEYFKEAFIFDSHQQIVPWTTRTIPYERIAQLITQVRYQIEHGMNDHRKQEKNLFDKLIQHAQSFDHLLGTHSSIYVFTIDIRIQDFLKPEIDLLAQVGRVQNSPIQDIKLILARFPDLLSGLIKVETHGAIEDLNLHCILILKSSKTIPEKKSIDVLQQEIQSFLGITYHVSIRNWNEVIRKNYSKNAVGLIKNSQIKKVEAFKYWVLSFFYTLDLHIQPYLPSQLKHLNINETLDSYLNMVAADNLNRKNYITVESSLKELEKANKALSKKFQPFLSEGEQKSVWSTRSLSKTSQAYIEAVMHYYRQIEPDSQKLQSMINIEIFIETLVTTELNAFELSVSGDQEVLTRQILRKAVTRLGRQFILLGENYTGELNHPRYAFLLQQQSFEISRDTMQQLGGFQSPKGSIERVNHIIANLRNLYTYPFEVGGGRSIQAIKNDSYKKYKRRLDDVTKLCNHLLQRDCLIFRVTVELIPKSEHISQADFFILWTAFLHQAQRAKPLSRKTGHWGLWRVDEERSFYADVFVVFDERALADRNSIIEQLNDKWIKFINNKAQLKLRLNDKPDFKHCRIQGKAMMTADGEYASDRLFIESTNTARKSDFLQKIIPAFFSHSLFEEAFHETYKQTNSGLLIKSSIAVAGRKNAPTPKLMKKIVPKAPVNRSEIDEDQ